MNSGIEVGSEWIYKPSPELVATVIFEDDKSVLFEYTDNKARCAFSRGNFLEAFTPKPRTITVNGVELPEPLREAPKVGEWYWSIRTAVDEGVYSSGWFNNGYDLNNLKRGDAFRTEADARAWFEFEVRQRGGEV